MRLQLCKHFEQLKFGEQRLNQSFRPRDATFPPFRTGLRSLKETSASAHADLLTAPSSGMSS